ncbi:MAG: hypothetical protein MK142_15235, partial [Pseudomonadales bacterium]|nr:hypothetical protein [Pseudomonadales bacterium]
DIRKRYDALIPSMPQDLAEVVDGIFRAEGLDPEIADRRLWRTIRDCVLSAHDASFEADA